MRVKRLNTTAHARAARCRPLRRCQALQQEILRQAFGAHVYQYHVGKLEAFCVVHGHHRYWLLSTSITAHGYRYITLIKLCFDFALALPGAGKHAYRDVRFGLFGSVGPLVNQLRLPCLLLHSSSYCARPVARGLVAWNGIHMQVIGFLLGVHPLGAVEDCRHSPVLGGGAIRSRVACLMHGRGC